MFPFVRSFLIVFVMTEIHTRLLKITAELYTGCKVLRITLETKEQIEHLQLISPDPENPQPIKFWNYPYHVGGTTLLHVSARNFDWLKRDLQEENIPFKVIIDDLQRQINLEKQRNFNQLTIINQDGAEVFELDRYHTLDEIYSHMETLKSEQKEISVHVKTFGRSIEKRPLKFVQIKKATGAEKSLIVVEGGAHAREWISPATSLYIISKLIEKNNGDQLLEKFDWLIIPVLNPDGYVYTWTKDRLWRKNRHIFYPNGRNSECNGVDLNRNFDVGYKMNIKYSYNSCSNMYGGTLPFSEPETSSFRDLMLPMKSKIKFFLSLHSYLQIWTTPYFYRWDYPPNYNKLEKMARKAVKILKSVNGNIYTYGPGIYTMYPATGSSLDWFYEKLNVSYSVILELPDKNRGFILPNDRIIPIGHEVWKALKHVVTDLK